MESSTLLFGSVLSLISAAIGAALHHSFAMRRMKAECKEHPTRVLYDRQIEFFGEAAPLVYQITSHITALRAWLAESEDSSAHEFEADDRTSGALEEFFELVKKHELYLPSRAIKDARSLYFRSMYFLDAPANRDAAAKCFDAWGEWENTARECLGVDRLSKDLQEQLAGAPPSGLRSRLWRRVRELFA